MFYKAREYDLGAITYYRDLHLTKEHGAYIARGFNSEGTHVAKAFNTLAGAKAWMCKQ